MTSIENSYIDYLYRELGSLANHLLSIKPGDIILRNTTKLNLFDHEHVVLWHNFLLNIFDPSLTGKPCALILPCSRIKPYRLSPLHRIVDMQIEKHIAHNIIQVYILSEPMLLVPRELDIYYPFANYDYPTYELNNVYREKFIYLLSKVLPKLSYHRYIAAFLPQHHYSILIDALNRCGQCLSIELFRYGKKAFEAAALVTRHVIERCKTNI